MPAPKDIQIDNGEFTRIHNTILETLGVARFTPSEFRIVMVLFRKTYGFQKKEDGISLKQWAELTDTDKAQTVRTLDDLVRKKVITRRDGLSAWVKIYGFNKHIEDWDPTIFQRVMGRQHKANVDQVVNESIDLTVNVDTTVNDETLTVRSMNVDRSVNETLTVVSPTKERKKLSKERPEPRSQTRPPNPVWEIALVLAEVCHVDIKVNPGPLTQTAKFLLKSKEHPPTPNLIRQHYNGGGWWWEHDWRGRDRHEFPTPSAIRATWGQWTVEAPAPAEPYANEVY